MDELQPHNASQGSRHEKLKGLRLLVVDDDDNTREMLSEVLRLYGADVRASSHAADALVVLQAWLPDVLVSDMGMPEEDGYTFIRKVRLLPAAAGGATPAIALTGYAGPEHRAHALSAGVQRFVAKPVDLDELIDCILQLARKPR
jgi:CheY-like chemotaxis protein